MKRRLESNFTSPCFDEMGARSEAERKEVLLVKAGVKDPRQWEATPEHSQVQRHLTHVSTDIENNSVNSQLNLP